MRVLGRCIGGQLFFEKCTNARKPHGHKDIGHRLQSVLGVSSHSIHPPTLPPTQRATRHRPRTAPVVCHMPPSLTAPFAVAFGGSTPAPPDASLQALEAELRQLDAGHFLAPQPKAKARGGVAEQSTGISLFEGVCPWGNSL